MHLLLLLLLLFSDSKLLSSYPYIVADTPNLLPGRDAAPGPWDVPGVEQAGLFFASKFPVNWAYFHPFNLSRPPSPVVMRGALAVTVDLEEVEDEASAMFFVTQLGSHQPDGHLTADTRRMLLDELADFVALQEHDAAFLMGDFGVSESKNADGYGETMRLLGLDGNPARDLFREVHKDVTEEPGFTVDGGKNGLVTDPMLTGRLDYILEVDGKVTVEKANIVPFGAGLEALTDHFGVHVDVGCEGRTNVGKSKPPKPPLSKRLLSCGRSRAPGRA